MTRVRVTLAAVLTVTATLLLASAAGSTTSSSAVRPLTSKGVFFAADGLRQDIVARYAAQGRMPTMAEFLKKGTFASGNGLLTQAPPNTGAGWYTLATGAWPGVHGSTNNTFHLNGQPFANRTAAFDPGVLQAESIAQSAERGGPQGRAGRVGRRPQRHDPGADDRLPVVLLGPRRRDELHRHAGRRRSSTTCRSSRAFGLQFDHPAGYAGQAPFPAPRRRRRTGWTRAAGVVQPAEGDAPARARLRHRQVRPERVHLRLDEQRHARATTRSSSRARRAAPTRSAILGKGEWADVKVKIAAAPSAGLTAGMLVKVEELNATSRASGSSTRPSAARSRAGRPGPASPASRGDFAEYLAQKFQTSTAADFAVLEAGVVSEETYVEQGLYWKTGHLPMLEYVVDDVRAGPAARRHADDGRVPAPVPRARLAEASRRRAEPGLRRRRPERRPRRPRRGARGVHPRRRTRRPTRSSSVRAS